MSQALRNLLPSSDPYLSPGEVIVCQVARGDLNGKLCQWSRSSRLTTKALVDLLRGRLAEPSKLDS